MLYELRVNCKLYGLSLLNTITNRSSVDSAYLLYLSKAFERSLKFQFEQSMSVAFVHVDLIT